MPRSPIARIQQRAKEIMQELNADNLLLAEVWDMIDPLPEESEAPAQTQGPVKAATCKFVAGNGELCGAFEDDPIHGDEDRQHKFQPRKSRTKKALPDSVSQRVAEDVSNARTLESGACAQCLNSVDANVHHKSTEPGYHEFKEAA